MFEGVCLIQSTSFSIEVIRQRSDLKDLEEKQLRYISGTLHHLNGEIFGD